MDTYKELMDGFVCTCPRGCEFSAEEWKDGLPPCSDCVYIVAEEDLPC